MATSEQTGSMLRNANAQCAQAKRVRLCLYLCLCVPVS